MATGPDRQKSSDVAPPASQPTDTGAFVTERLRLVALAFEHAPLLVQLDRDPEVMRYLTGGRASTRAEVDDTIRRSLGHRWVAFGRADGDFVGWFSLRPTAEREYELGYRLQRHAWGRGLAAEGSRHLVDIAFGERGARRVWAQTMAVNTASRRVMTACGMTHVRTFHVDWDDPIDGAEHGEVEYEVRRAAWTRRQLQLRSSR